MLDKERMAEYQRERRARLKFVSAADLEDAAAVIGESKRAEMVATDLPVFVDPTPKAFISEAFIDVEKDLKLNLEKDLGITGWTRDGIFIRPDITIKQVQNIARLIHAKHGRPCPDFRQCGV